MSEVIGSVQVVVRPDTTGFAEKARDGIERQFRKKNALELDFQVDPDSVRRDVEDARDLAQKWLDLKKNALKVKVGLDWKKTDLVSQLRDFKSDVEALEKLHRPTVHANFEVDRKSIDKIRENVQLNISVDSKALRKEIEKATKGISVFGDKKAVEKNAKKLAELSSQVFQDIFAKRKLKFEMDADRAEIERLAGDLAQAYRELDRAKGVLFDYEDELADATAAAKKQAEIVSRLSEEWEEIQEYGAQNSRHMAAVANDLTEAENSLREMVKHESKLRRLRDLHTSVNITPLAEETREVQKEFDKLHEDLDNKEVRFKAIADRVTFTAVAAEVNAIARDRIVTFYARIRKNSIAQLERQMAALSRHSKDFGANIAKYLGQLAGVRVLWRTFRDMVDWLPRLDMMVPQLAQNFALLTGAATGAVGALGMVFTLLSDIGEVAKLALAAPALLGGVVGSALIVGRAIQDFKTVFPEIINFYERLGDIVSDRVWKRAAGPIRELHAATAPLLSAHVPNWATAWGDAMGSLARGVNMKGSLLALESFLENSIEGTKKATKGWEHLGAALVKMMGAGSEVFPDLGTWFSDTMADFDRWVSTNYGNISDWIREGMTALSELGSIGVSTVKIIAGVADAFNAAGWPGLTELANGMRAVGDAALALKDSDWFMQPLEQMRYFFEQFSGLEIKLEEAFKNLWGMIGDSAENLARPMANALAYILDGFNSDKFGSGFGKFISGIASFIQDIGPGLGAMTAEIGSLLGVVGTAAKSWGPAFNDMLLLFSSAGDNLHPGLLDFVENLGPRLQDLVTDITPHVEDFSTALGNLLGNENFQDLIGDLIGDIGALAGALLDLGTWVLDVAGKFSDWYGGLSDGQQDFVRWTGIIIGFAGGALTLLGGAVLKVVGVLQKLGGAFKFLKLDKLFGGLKKTGIGKAIASLADDIALRAMYFWDKVKGVGTRIGNALRGIPSAIGRGASALWNGLKSVGARAGGAIRGLADDIALRAMYLWDSVKRIGSRIGGALRNLGTTIGNAFRGLAGKIKLPTLKGIGGGLSKLLAPIGNFVKGIPGALAKILPKGGLLKLVGKALTRFIPVVGWILLAKDLMNLIKPVSVLDWVEGITRGLGLDGVADIIGGIKDNIANIFGEDVGLVDLFNPITNALHKAWEGMLAGWESGGFWGAVKGFFSGFADGFTDVFELFWANLKDSLIRATDWLQQQAANWQPTSTAGQFAKDIVDRLPGLLGLNDDGTFSWDTLISSWKEFGSELWTNYIQPWLADSWDSLVNWARQWEPLNQALGFFEDPWGKIQEWLGITELVTGITNFLASPVEWGTNLWNETIQPWLTDSWDKLVAAIVGWAPVAAVIEFFDDPWGKIKEWLGIDGWGDSIPTVGEIAEWGTGLWNDTVQPWLQDSWDKLIGFIQTWNPIAIAFNFGTWVGDKVKEWLGVDGETLDLSNFSIDFDFSSLWEQKIKPALTTGLLALAGLILAPGLVLIAPLALPPLIIGWLLGRDGEGNWSFQELTNKITGAWEKIKGALSSGVETVKGLIGGLVMTPIAIGTKIVEWVLGSDWVEKAKTGLTTAIENAAPALNSAIETGLGAIGTAASGPGTAGAKAGGALRRALGIDEPGKGKISLDFDHIGGLVRKFGGITRGEYSDTSTSVGGSTREMSNKAKANFDKMRHDAKSSTGGMKSNTARDMANMSATAAAKAAQMQANVVRKMTTMQTQAGAKAAVMQRNVVRSMTQANVLGVRQATVMATAYVAAMNRLASGAARVASRLRGTLPNLLRINAGGAGNYTGNSFVSGLSSGLSRAVGVARGMAGRIRGALRFNVFSSGAAVGSSFASGLRSRIGSVGAAASALAAAARSRMPNSPADEGPFSGKGWGGWGESIAEELARGLRMGAPKVAREASRMMAATAAELSQTSQVSFAPDVKSISRALSTGEEALIGAGSGTTVNVNVTSRSEEPLQDGNRFGGDIAFALRGAGLA